MPGTINIKVIHPTNNSDIDIGVPEEILLRDIFAQLIEANFLLGGQQYSGVNKSKDNRPLDNEKSIGENDVENTNTILTVLSTNAGGGFDIVQLWQDFFSYLDQIGTVGGIAGATIGFGVWIKNKFAKKYTPKEFTSVITDKELWNAHELALLLNITDEESKSLLKGFGYKWDKRFSLYYKTDKTIEIIEKIQKVGD